MRKIILQLLLGIFPFSSFAFHSKNSVDDEPLFQLGAGPVYSSIDLSRYNGSVIYRGFHAHLVTHISSVFFLSTEYSSFPVHESPSAWIDVHTRKFDVNGHVSFKTQSKLTHIYALGGINKHEWKGKRTAFTDMDQFAKNIPEGAYASVNRWGANVGGGITHLLYENIAIFADYRFCFSKSIGSEKIRIYDVMTTIGVNFNIPHPHPSKSNSKKTFGIGKKIYKWTEKGAQ